MSLKTNNKENLLQDPYEWINDVADETKELFELDDMLYDVSMKIFDYRIEKNMTQNELSNVLGISQAMVSKLESGEYNPTIGLLWKISKKLNMELEIVLSDKKIESKAKALWASKKNVSKTYEKESYKEGISA